MRILYFADIRFPLERANGIQTMATCHALAGRGHRVDLVVRRDTHDPARDPFGYYGLARLPELSIEIAPVAGPPAARRAGYMAYALGRAIGRSRADIVCTRDLGVASMLLRLPRPARPPLVYESHGYAPDVAGALPGLVTTAAPAGPAKLARLARRESRVWRDADGYVTITAGLAADLRARFGDRGALAIVPDGARLPDGEPAFGPQREAGELPTVGYAGHLYPWKGVDILLRALARLPGARGLIVGGHHQEPDLPRLRSLAESLQVADRVRFTGLVAPSEVPALLGKADVLALPNPASAIATRFTSPLKLFEYMASGRPIVASDLPALREVLQHDVNAWLVPAGDEAALADGIGRLLADPALATRLARAAFAGAREYSWERRAERLEQAFAVALRAPT